MTEPRLPVGPKNRPALSCHDRNALRAAESTALITALRKRHPLGTSKAVSSDLMDQAGFDVAPDTVSGWLADGKRPSDEAMAALDAVYGPDFVMERRAFVTAEHRALKAARLQADLAAARATLAQLETRAADLGLRPEGDAPP
jgi:hypothetical protein